jgi:hypothetical protein
MNVGKGIAILFVGAVVVCLTGCRFTADQPIPEAATQPGQVQEIDIVAQDGRFAIRSEPGLLLLTMPFNSIQEPPSPDEEVMDSAADSARDPADAEDEDDEDDEEQTTSDSSMATPNGDQVAQADSSAGADTTADTTDDRSSATTQPSFEELSRPVEDLPDELTKMGFPPKPPLQENSDILPGEPLFVVFSADADEKARIRQIILHHGYPCITLSMHFEQPTSQPAEESSDPEPESQEDW